MVFVDLYLVRLAVRNEDPRVVTLERSHHQPIWFRSWRTEAEPLITQVEVRLDKCWRHRLRTERPAKHQQRKVLGGFRAVHHYSSKIINTIAVEIIGRNIGMVIANRCPVSSVSSFHLLDVFGAIAVCICGDTIVGMFSQPSFENFLFG